MVIPNHNGVATIGACLDALRASDFQDFEVVVVDDGSSDGSTELIARYPGQVRGTDRQTLANQSGPDHARLRPILLPERRGAAAARNAGALAAQGKFIFFIDADCIVLPDTLTLAAAAARRGGPELVVGGTYTPRPYDPGFFSLFQSVFINHFECKRRDNPDYIASHAMLIAAAAFRRSGGFPRKFLPIIEDVEFSHHLRRQGFKLQMAPEIMVRHVFNYDLVRSLANAKRKARYWTIYSLGNRDLLSDSGTASSELKINVGAFALTLVLICAALLAGSFFPAGPDAATLVPEPGFFTALRPPTLLGAAMAVQFVNLLVQNRLLRSFYRAGGPLFAARATIYYSLLYPLPVGWGALTGFAALYLAKESYESRS